MTKAELESIGLGDPTAALRDLAVKDLFAVGVIYVVSLALALGINFGDKLGDFIADHESWQLDEFLVAGIVSMVAFSWFSWRQWSRYAGEVSRRLKLEEDMVEMRVMADHLGENKSLFLANLAHDFRTPLNGILGFAQLLEEEPFGPIGNERYATYIKTIRESAIMLNERIDTCLDPAKIEFGSEPLQMISYPLKNAVNNAMPILHAMAQSAGIKIQDDVGNDLPDLHADKRALKKIIINLVTNAIKHSRPKGTVWISASLTEAYEMELVIRDNGIGMDRRLVAAFERSHTPTPVDNADHGVPQGVGLSVVRKLLDMHDARIAIETNPKKGTTITATFPSIRVIPRSSRN